MNVLKNYNQWEMDVNANEIWQTQDVLNPATGEVLATGSNLGKGAASEVDKAVAAAHAAYL